MAYKSVMSLQLKENLKGKLKEREIGVPTLAKRTGISRKTIENWMEGQRPQNIEQVKVVAKFFGTTVDEICFGPDLRTGNALTELERHQNEINAGIFEVVLRRIK